MAGVYKGLTIKIGADTTGLSGALNEIDAQTRAMKREMSAVSKALKLDPTNTELARQKMELYQKEIKATSERLSMLKKAEKDGDYSEVEDKAAAQRTLQRDIAFTTANLEKLNSEYRKFTVEQAAAESGIGRAGAAITAFGEKADRAGQKMQSAGRGLTAGLTVPIAAAATASVKAAVDIDTGLTDVRKTVDGTEEDFQRLKEAAIEFSQSNAVKAADMLSVESLGAQLGYTLDLLENGKSEIQEFGEVVSGLDIATNMSAEQAGTELAQFFNIMGESKERTSNFGSAIVGLGNSFATTESDVSAMAMRIAGAGKNIGLSSADVLGLSTALTSLGINAEAGGTAISTVMSDIDKSVALESGNLETWAETARMSVDEFKAAWGEDAVGALDAVLKGMGESTDEGGNLAVMLEELGIKSIRQTDMMKRLANSGDLMARAVAKSNEEWEANTALAAEVANRNDSLAAKFDILRNRVIAVAEDVGKPLADAMLGVVNAAQPLFEAVENGARAFSDMDEGEQRAILGTVAIIAALGPTLSLFGKLATNVKVLGGALTALSRGLAAVDLASNGTAKGMKAASDATEKMAAKQLAASTAMGAAKAAAAGLAIAGVAVLTAAIVDYYSKQREHEGKLRKATDDMRHATERMRDSASIAALGFDELSASAEGAGEQARDFGAAADEAAEKAISFAESVNGKLDGAEASAILAETLAGSIKDLAGECDGNAEKLAELNELVRQYNDATGSNLAVVDDFTGRLNHNTEELDLNTEAFKQNVMAKAYQEVLADAAKQEAEYRLELEKATEAKESAIEANKRLFEAYGYDDVMANHNGELSENNAIIRDASAAEEQLNRQIGDSVDLRRRATKSMVSANDEAERQRDLYAQARSDADSYRQALEGLGAGAEALDIAFSAAKDSEAGFEGDLGAFVQKLNDAGIGARQLANVATDEFARLYREAAGDIGLVGDALSKLDSFGVDPKHILVTDDGTVKLNMALVDDLDRRKLAEKGFEVTDDGTIRRVSDELSELDGQEAKPSVSVDTSQAERDLARIRQNLADLGGSGATISGIGLSRGGHAAGGVLEHPLRIPRHADGGISGVVTRATLTNQGLVGEAGAEYVHRFGGGSAIVPIENSRYVRPLAKAISAEMGGGGGTVNNTTVYIRMSYDAGADAARIVDDIAGELKVRGLMEA